MIEALERGCGVLPDSMMEGSLQTAFQEDPERLFALMEEKTDLFQLFFTCISVANSSYCSSHGIRATITRCFSMSAADS